MTPTPKPTAGENVQRASRLPIHGAKRLKTLLLIAAWIDAGHQPSIGELAARLGLHRVAVVALIDHLERDGLLEVERRWPERNAYRIPERKSARA